MPTVQGAKGISVHVSSEIKDEDELTTKAYVDTKFASVAATLPSIDDGYPFEAYPIIVDNIYTTNKVVSSLSGSSILLAQVTASENGYYVGTTKTSLTENTIFVDIVTDTTAFYDNTTSNFLARNIRRFNLDKAITTTSATAVYISIPVIQGRITSVNVMATAHDNSGNLFQKNISSLFTNISGTLSGPSAHLPSLTHGKTNFSASDVTFDTTGSPYKVKIVGEAASTVRWHIKGSIHL